MKKGCAYCDEMHRNCCPDAFSDVAQYCGKYDNDEVVQIDRKNEISLLYASLEEIIDAAD